MYEGVFADIHKDANAQLNILKPPLDEIAAILSRRFRELIESKNGHDVYYAATFLHPGILKQLLLFIPRLFLFDLFLNSTPWLRHFKTAQSALNQYLYWYSIGPQDARGSRLQSQPQILLPSARLSVYILDFIKEVRKVSFPK